MNGARNSCRTSSDLVTSTEAATARRDPVVELLQAERSDYRGLYYRWEQEQWQAGKVDLAGDGEQWADLDDEVRRPIAAAVAWRHLRARQATTALVPFVDAAPSEEQQVFLTTELVDEARHVVLFDRFATEVMGEDAANVAARAPDVEDEAMRELLLDVLPETSRRLAAAAQPNLGSLVSAVAVYQLGIVGLVDLTEQRLLAEHLRSQRLLPGLLEALQLTTRDAARHTAFALRLFQEAAASGDGDRSGKEWERLAGLLGRVLQARGVGLGGGGAMHEAARSSCAAWFEAVGLEAPPRF